jgi:hypothetical protein
MRLQMVAAVALSSLAAGFPVLAQCTASNGHTAEYSTVRLAPVNLGSMPAAVQQGITDGMGAWNNSACNDGDDFPSFFTSGTFQPAIQVVYDTQVSQTLDGNGNTVCASITIATDGSSGTISLYETQRLANGQTNACYPNSAIAADSVAHELGHYLGLGDVSGSCTDYIMGPRTGSMVNGQMVWSTSRQVQSAECSAADARSVTPTESTNESGGDPFCQAYGCSPILVDLENDGIHLTGLGDPVWFDIDADGDLDAMAWTDRSEGMLALDRNGNGVIDDGNELFGNATHLADGTRASNGYIALAELDAWTAGGNQDGVITAADAAFGSLRMWTDLNHDGLSQAEELLTLDEAGIRRMDLDYRESRRRDRYGNEFRFLGTAWKIGRHGALHPVLTWDVFFTVSP